MAPMDMWWHLGFCFLFYHSLKLKTFLSEWVSQKIQLSKAPVSDNWKQNLWALFLKAHKVPTRFGPITNYFSFDEKCMDFLLFIINLPCLSGIARHAYFLLKGLKMETSIIGWAHESRQYAAKTINIHGCSHF